VADLTGPFSAPAPLTAEHDLSQFRCSHSDLTDWLQRRARANEAMQASRTWVTCLGVQVVGYYALAAGAIEREVVPGSMRRNMPTPIPAVILARLAVDERCHRQGLGKGLLRHAVLRSLQVAEAIGTRILLAHAIDVQAVEFYEKQGFSSAPQDSQLVLLDLMKVQRSDQ